MAGPAAPLPHPPKPPSTPTGGGIEIAGSLGWSAPVQPKPEIKKLPENAPTVNGAEGLLKQQLEGMQREIEQGIAKQAESINPGDASRQDLQQIANGTPLEELFGKPKASTQSGERGDQVFDPSTGESSDKVTHIAENIGENLRRNSNNKSTLDPTDGPATQSETSADHPQPVDATTELDAAEELRQQIEKEREKVKQILEQRGLLQAQAGDIVGLLETELAMYGPEDLQAAIMKRIVKPTSGDEGDTVTLKDEKGNDVIYELTSTSDKSTLDKYADKLLSASENRTETADMLKESDLIGQELYDKIIDPSITPDQYADEISSAVENALKQENFAAANRFLGKLSENRVKLIDETGRVSMRQLVENVNTKADSKVSSPVLEQNLIGALRSMDPRNETGKAEFKHKLHSMMEHGMIGLSIFAVLLSLIQQMESGTGGGGGGGGMH